jgi:two-component system chemotaxis sensor kinase CheA
LLARLQGAINGEAAPAVAAPTAATAIPIATAAAGPAVQGPDWQQLYQALVPQAGAAAECALTVATQTSPPPLAAATPARRTPEKSAARETTIRIDTHRLDQVLNISGEVGLTKNRLNCVRHAILSGNLDSATLSALDRTVNQLDLLVSDLQNAVMKTRMQPVGRLFQKYPRLARDLSRSLGKDIELVISGEETEIDRGMIDDLADPLVHLVRNAVDHGVETPDERKAAGKPAQSIVRLSARQSGDHIEIVIADDGRGMRPDVLRRKAMEKGLLDLDAASTLDENASLHLIFLPGFSTKDQVSSVSGRGVGMDVVKSNITRLNGRIDIESIPGRGTTFTISLPLTLAILPVLMVKHGTQPFAVPLSMVHEIIPLTAGALQSVGGRATLAVRGEVLPVSSLGSLLGWDAPEPPRHGLLMQAGPCQFILAVTGYMGREDVVIKPLTGVKPKGVAGATLAGDGSVVLVLDIESLMEGTTTDSLPSLFANAA